MEVRFIHHSCYTVELEKTFLIFDYFSGKLKIPKNKKIIFITSHGHEDHFDPIIYRYRDQAKYILSDHVNPIDPNIDVKIMKPGDKLSAYGINGYAYGSTDEGMSILIEAEGKRIYHSGDLNFWLWPDYTVDDIGEMYREFTAEVIKAATHKPIDICMALVDPRMKDYYYLTGEYFLKSMEPKHFFPLHLWNDFDLSKTFKKRFEKNFPNTVIHSIQGDGEIFKI